MNAATGFTPVDTVLCTTSGFKLKHDVCSAKASKPPG